MCIFGWFDAIAGSLLVCAAVWSAYRLLLIWGRSTMNKL